MNEILFYDRPDLVERIADALKQPVGAMHKDAVVYWAKAELRGVQLPPPIIINGNVVRISEIDDDDKIISVICQQARRNCLLMLWSYSIREYEDHSRITVRGDWSQLPAST